MILVFTGDGKGKTSTAVGQAVRALGQGLRVGFFQYLKREGAAGEQKILRSLLGDSFAAGGLGFLRDTKQFPAHRKAAFALTKHVFARIPELDMLVLDEALYALKAELLTKDELRGIITLCGEKNAHLVLTGRNAPEWLVERADLVTEMREIKHPLAQGVPAARGIEF